MKPDDRRMKMKRVFPILGLLTAVLLSYALYEALVAAPTEQTMGNVQRIFYYHVPSAWTAFLLFLHQLCLLHPVPGAAPTRWPTS